MRALVFDGPGAIRVRDDFEDPAIVDQTDAIIDVTLAGLCGSDLHPFEGREASARGVVPGHEAVGIVRMVGSQVSSISPGDRVLVPFTVSCGWCERCTEGMSSRCTSSRLFGWGDPAGDAPLHGGQAGALRVPLADGTAVRVPDGIDDDTAVLLSDNFPTAWHAVSRTDWTKGPLAVIGLGAVGLCAVAAAHARGVGDILAIDPVESRRAAATALGASTASPSEATGRFGAIVEAAGPLTAQRLAVDLADVGATISIIAVQTSEHFGIHPVNAYDKNLTIRTGRAPVRSVLAQILPGVADGTIRVPTSTVVTHPDRPLSDGPELYRSFAARDGALIKAMFRP
ncbi:MAG: alcohol dehydrogenase catalytic domain-containing protein [Acidimicrobiia bacterium]